LPGFFLLRVADLLAATVAAQADAGDRLDGRGGLAVGFGGDLVAHWGAPKSDADNPLLGHTAAGGLSGAADTGIIRLQTFTIGRGLPLASMAT
jgi:hypothetical protein